MYMPLHMQCIFQYFTLRLIEYIKFACDATMLFTLQAYQTIISDERDDWMDRRCFKSLLCSNPDSVMESGVLQHLIDLTFITLNPKCEVFLVYTFYPIILFGVEYFSS